MEAAEPSASESCSLVTVSEARGPVEKLDPTSVSLEGEALYPTDFNEAVGCFRLIERKCGESNASTLERR